MEPNKRRGKLCPPPIRRLHIGKISKIRGLRGELKVVPLTWNPGRFKKLEGVWCATGTAPPRYLTFDNVSIESGALFIRFLEITTRESAETLTGADLFLDTKDRADLPQGYFYHDDLVDCEVYCQRHGRIGLIKAVLDDTAQPLLRVHGGSGEILIPFVEAFVREIDCEIARILVDLPEGFLEV